MKRFNDSDHKVLLKAFIRIRNMEKDSRVVVVEGFTVLQTRFSSKSRTGHYIYVKNYTSKEVDESRPRDKTLFVLNVPPYCNEECLKRVFSKCGKVHQVYLHDRPIAGALKSDQSTFFPDFVPSKGFKVAYIVFKSAVAMKKAKTLPYDVPLILSQEDAPVLTGMRKWCQQYRENKTDTKAMQKEIDKYMIEYDRLMEKEKQKALEDEGQPDEEGWVTVTRHGKNKGAPRTETMEKKVTARDRKRRKEKELKNFYKFQIRETKRDQIADLRKKFEEDKQRIAIMKASRKFRPY